MPFKIVLNDITKMKVDAIVNAANRSLLGGGGVDGCIHRAAGRRLLEECRTLGGCETGQSKITGAYKLDAKYVIHTVGPKYSGGDRGEKELLESCYKTALALAKEHGCETVAFPLISSGIYRYPKAEAFRVASDTICRFLEENEMTVYLVIFSKSDYAMDGELYEDIERHLYPDINRTPVPAELPCVTAESTCGRRGFLRRRYCKTVLEPVTMTNDPSFDEEPDEPCFDEVLDNPYFDGELDERLNSLDESFSEMLLRKIAEKGMTDAQCYKRANIDRKLFSKIRGDAGYKPSKPTAVAFAIALELSIDEMEDMLKKAGFALSESNKFDVIIRYFAVRKIYDVHKINEALFAYDQLLLGA